MHPLVPMLSRPIRIAGLALVAALLAAPRAADAVCVIRADLDGVVNAAAADYLEDALEATGPGCAALLVVIDTPGGDLEATRRIVRAFLSAERPVITYVAPGGARAGSAGMFIALAGHVAAMAPGTNIGAAHPVIMGGKDPEEAGGKHMAAKIESDTAAFARALAERRGRDPGWVERAVVDSASATASEALEAGVIDVISVSAELLVEELDGREVDLRGETAVLGTAGAEIRRHPMTLSQQVRSVLGHPNFVYVLFMIGILGILIEVSSPGLIIPGVIGGTSLVLAAIGMNALPVSVGALILMLIGAGLLIAELYVVSFGLLTLGGVGALVLASTLLVDRSESDFFADPAVGVSWGAVIPLAALLAVAAGLLAWMVARSRRRGSPTGTEGLIGARGVALDDLGPAGGWIRVGGERWEALVADPIEAGAAVEVVGVEGLRLRVRPAHRARERTAS